MPRVWSWPGRPPLPLLCRLVNEAAALVLAAHQDIVGQRLRVQDAVAVAQHLLQEGKDASDPEGIAAVHQLVCAPLKAALEPHLPHDRPALRWMMLM